MAPPRNQYNKDWDEYVEEWKLLDTGRSPPLNSLLLSFS
jgi:hypothetical protein